MAVFISHITEEAPIALLLKDWVESTFLGQWKVFVSSDSDDIPPGSSWLGEIDKALDEAKILLILCSPQSINRPWINFEAGCGWVKQIPIIPLCHSGLNKGNLPMPLSTFQALNIEEHEYPRQFLQAIAKHLGVPRLPPIDYDALAKQLEIVSTELSLAIEHTNSDIEETTHANTGALSNDELDILLSLAGVVDDYISVEDVADGLKIHAARAQYYVDKLEQSHYLIRSQSFTGSSEYSLSHAGREILIENGSI